MVGVKSVSSAALHSWYLRVLPQHHMGRYRVTAIFSQHVYRPITKRPVFTPPFYGSRYEWWGNCSLAGLCLFSSAHNRVDCKCLNVRVNTALAVFKLLTRCWVYSCKQICPNVWGTVFGGPLLRSVTDTAGRSQKWETSYQSFHSFSTTKDNK